METETITQMLRTLTRHDCLAITTRGNTAIDAAIAVLPKNKILLIPEEGGWIHYRKVPQKWGLKSIEIRCQDAALDLPDLQQKVEAVECSALLYQNPGGYFAEQKMEKIYSLCRKRGCLVIMDVSGSLGTRLCDGRYADIIIGSFGKWKLVDAHVGGFLSCKQDGLFEACRPFISELKDKDSLAVILKKLQELPQRIKYLEWEKKRIIDDLEKTQVILKKDDLGFVMIVPFRNDEEKETIINYCKNGQLPWTECPRYVRINKPAISIEIKRLHEEKKMGLTKRWD